MKLCSEECIPCCDYCLNVIQDHFDCIDCSGKKVRIEHGGPIGCKKHTDSLHQEIAKSCYYCEDFHCKNV